MIMSEMGGRREEGQGNSIIGAGMKSEKIAKKQQRRGSGNSKTVRSGKRALNSIFRKPNAIMGEGLKNQQIYIGTQDDSCLLRVSYERGKGVLGQIHLAADQ